MEAVCAYCRKITLSMAVVGSITRTIPLVENSLNSSESIAALKLGSRDIFISVRIIKIASPFLLWIQKKGPTQIAARVSLHKHPSCAPAHRAMADNNRDSSEETRTDSRSAPLIMPMEEPFDWMRQSPTRTIITKWESMHMPMSRDKMTQRILRCVLYQRMIMNDQCFGSHIALTPTH